jgi:hypothetical protein
MLGRCLAGLWLGVQTFAKTRPRRVRYIQAGGGRRVGRGLPLFASHMSA